MKFSLKKKLLSAAFKKINQITSIIEAAKDMQAIRVVASDGGLVIGTSYAEVKIRDVKVKETGEVLLDKNAFSRAVSVSGDTFTLSVEGEKAVSARFTCGKAKGPIATTADGYVSDLLADAPKSSITVEVFGDLLRSLKLSTKEESDRCLHVENGTSRLRGESSDGYLAIIVEVNTSDITGDSVSFALNSKVCDTLASLLESATAKVGYNEDFISIKAQGFRCLIPTVNEAPLEIKAQVSEWIAEQKNYGQVVVKTSEIKAALTNASLILGKDVDLYFDLSIPSKSSGNTAAVSGRALGGDVDIKFDIENSTLEEPVILQVDGLFLSECLSRYKTECVRMDVMEGLINLTLVEPTDSLVVQEAGVPLRKDISEYGQDAYGEEEEFEDDD